MMLLTPSTAAVWKRAMLEEPRFVGLLDSPGTLHLFSREEDVAWALDNGAFTRRGFRKRAFLRALEVMEPSRNRCLFVVSPDVVCDPEKTHNLFTVWGPRIQERGFPVAYVSQDGLELKDVPWDHFRCFFVGGSTEWKLSPESVALCREAKKHGKWLHIGRVNSRKRVLFCHHIGADSFDGTHFGIAPTYAASWVLPMLRWLNSQPGLEIGYDIVPRTE